MRSAPHFALSAAHQALDADNGLKDANPEKAVRGIGAALTRTLDKIARFDRETLVA
jgi:hypothetical protein